MKLSNLFLINAIVAFLFGLLFRVYSCNHVVLSMGSR